MKYNITTKVHIKASPEEVWQVFSDFKRYPDWNPFIKSLGGNFEKGGKLHAHIDTMKFSPRVLEWKPKQAFAWLGHLWSAGIFDGHHQFYLREMQDGSTEFIQSEDFSGILVGLMKGKLDRDFKPKFELMNRALKERVEKSRAQ